MTRFIWIKDIDNVDHYVNVNHIIRVTKVPSHGSFSAAGYIILCDRKEIQLSNKQGHLYDMADDVISKIQVAMS